MAGKPRAGGSPRELTQHEGDLEADEPYDRLLFADAAFDSVTAGNCHFMDCAFRNVRFTGADFTKVTCTDVDLRGASLGISAGIDSLRGATIDTVQLVGLAPLLARHLGITVAD